MRWQRLAIGMMVLGVAGQAAADTPRKAVVSAGSDVGMLAPVETGAATEVGLYGYFARLSWEGVPPPYTTARKGYIWRGAVVPDVGISRSWSTEGQRLSSASVGLRADLLFSQRRMGLFEVSARGGFWVAARAGMAVLDPPANHIEGKGIVPLSGDVADSAAPSVIRRNAEGAIYDAAFGAHFSLWDSDLRFEYEIGVFMLDENLAEDTFGMRVRLGVGAYF